MHYHVEILVSWFHHLVSVAENQDILTFGKLSLLLQKYLKIIKIYCKNLLTTGGKEQYLFLSLQAGRTG